jgi:DNA polymerase-3 subunit beta
MKINVNARELVRALKASHSERKTTIPVLTFARITAAAHGGAIAIHATDLDLHTVVDVAGEVIQPGEGLLPYRQTLDVLKGETGDVELTLHPGTPAREPSYYALYDPDGTEISRHQKQADADEARRAAGAEDRAAGRPCVYREVRPAPDGVAEVWAKVTLRISGCDFTLVGSSLANFPSFDHLGLDTATPVTVLDALRFRRALDHVAIAISHEESRYTLNGLLLDVGRDAAQLVATDGHRLSHYRLLGDLGDGAGNHSVQGKYLISSAAIAWLRANLDGKVTGEIRFGVSGDEGQFHHFTLDGKHLVARKLTGNFPNYEAVLPREDSERYRATILDSAALVKTLGRLGKIADERSGAVKVRVNGTLTIAASNTDVGSALATIPASIRKFDGDGAPLEDDAAEVAIGFNACYVDEFLRLAGKGESTLAIKDAQSAAWFTAPVPGGEAWKYVLMPLRI